MSSLPLSSRRTALRVFPIALAIPAAAAPAVRADSITYDVTLSPVHGAYAGTGTITLASAPSTSGITTYSAAKGQLEDLNLTIDNQTFSLAGDPDASVLFTNGQLTAIDFAETVNHPPARYTLELSDGFDLYANGFGHSISSGSLTAALASPVQPVASSSPTTDTSSNPDTLPASGQTTPSTPAASPTPEPGSLLLLATALLAGGFFLFRHKRTAQS